MKINNYIIVSILFTFSLNINAAYLENVPQNLVQPNGDIIHCFASGDEFHNWLHDSLGYTIIQNPQTGYYVYALQSGKDIAASEYVVGIDNPVDLRLTPNVNLSAQKRYEKRAAIEAMTPKRNITKTSERNHGHINNLVLSIRFADEGENENNISSSSMNEFHNDSSSISSNSMYNFFKQSSYGKLTVTSHFFPTPCFSLDILYSYQDIHPRSYYSQQSPTNPDGYANFDERTEREHGLLVRTVEYLADEIPETLDLDFNNDGFVDNICFITSGSPEGWNDLLWPHRWALYTEHVEIHGKRVWDYNFIMGTYVFTSVITHEFMHTLGAPDLYRYYEGTEIEPVGRWDLMASTAFMIPQGLGAYMKYKYGNWIEPIPEITTPGTYTLYPANDLSLEPGHQTAYRIATSASPDDYIVLEYRSRSSNVFESGLPNSGLLIYRINEEYEGNAYYDGNTVFDEVYIFRPGGNPINNGSINQASFSASYRTEFGRDTSPYPFCTDGTIIDDIYIYIISSDEDSIQFSFKNVADRLTINRYSLRLEYTELSSASFDIESNTSWEFHGDIPSWLNVSDLEGTGNATITVSSVAENISEEMTCQLLLRIIGQNGSKVITIYQNSYPLLTNKEELQLEGHENATANFTIQSRVDWEIENNLDWITLSESEGSTGTFDITVTANENNTGHERTGALLVSSESLDKIYSISIAQDSYTSIKETEKDEKVIIYPNPAKDILNIYFANANTFSEISIYTITGELVYHSSISDNNMKIDVANLSSGVYVVKFNSANEVDVRKFVKQ